MHPIDEQVKASETTKTTDSDGGCVELRQVRLSNINRDPALQVRRKTRPATVARYAEIFDALPPVDVFDVGGEQLLLSDGFQRCEAAENLAKEYVSVKVHQGTLDDAYAFAVEANAKSGEPLTMAERNDAIVGLCRQHHGPYGWKDGWTKRKVAKIVGVKEDTVDHVLDAARVAESIDATMVKDGNGIRFLVKSAPRGMMEESGEEAGGKAIGLSMGHLQAIGKAPADVQREIAIAAQQSGWTRNDTRSNVARLMSAKVKPEEKARLLSGGPSLFPADGHSESTTPDSQPAKAEPAAVGLFGIQSTAKDEQETLRVDDRPKVGDSSTVGHPSPDGSSAETTETTVLLDILTTLQGLNLERILESADEDTLNRLRGVLPDCAAKLGSFFTEVRNVLDAVANAADGTSPA